MRPLPTAVSALAIALLSSGVVRAEQCRPIDTTIVTWFGPNAARTDISVFRAIPRATMHPYSPPVRQYNLWAACEAAGS